MAAADSQKTLDETGIWAAMSHEIRTPLMGVVGMLEILSRTSLTDEQRRIIATMGESSHALMRIVDDVLDLAKLESARASLSPVATDIADLVESATASLAAQAEAKGLAITCEVDTLPSVVCDPLRVRQVLLNLGTNAVKFTDAGHVALSVHAADGSNVSADTAALRFTIEDSGIGIPQELQGFLFRPFAQLAAGRGLGGVGLGLAICRNLVEAMRGRILVDSTPGIGTRFHVDVAFPVSRKDVATFTPPSVEALSIVAVDSGEPALQIALRYLAGAGAQVQRIGALSDIGGLADDAIVLIGPGAEADDVRAATSTLARRAGAQIQPSLLWLYPRAVGGTQVLARQGVRGICAHPLRRADLFAAVMAAREMGPLRETPVLTRHVDIKPLADHDAAAQARVEGRVILVAEDNAINQQVLRQQLAILGFDCDIAGNGAAALQALREQKYLLLLCDCHMPGMGGLELTQQIRVNEKAQGASVTRLPIIAITANAMQGEAERCRVAGMDDYLAKPIEISNLKAAIDRWLDKSSDVRHPSLAARVMSAMQVRDAPARTAVIDLNNLKALFGDDSTRLRPVLNQWRTAMELAAADLRAALADRRWDDAGLAAHRIKGSAGIAGAHGLSLAATALESALQQERLAAAAEEGARVLAGVDEALHEVMAWDANAA